MEKANYKVIARKYRPTTFEEVIGQEHITKTISQSILQGKNAHAYLFSGPHGVGKTSLARIIAKALNCKEGPTDKPCGVCNSCVEIARGNPLDVIEIDGASNRGIENIRSVIESVRISPVSSKYKIYIIDEVHQITNEAFNALLKTLEEPPAHVVFILATTEADKVLPTIRSRCQQYTFKLLTVDNIISILKHILSKEEIKYSEEALFLIAKQSRGSVRDAETILEKMIAYTADKKSIEADDVRAVVGSNNFGYIKKFFDIVISSDKKEYFSFVKELFANAIEPRSFLNNLIEYMRIVLMMKAGISDTKLLEVPQSEYEDMLGFVNHFNDDEIERMLEYVLSVEEKVRYATQQKIIFEMRLILMLDTDNLIRAKDVLSQASNTTTTSTNSTATKNISEVKTTSLNTNEKASNESKVKPNLDPNDKRHIFYKNILNFIETESPTIYSLLSQGNPLDSAGATLIVTLPIAIYEMVVQDKRIPDLITKAIARYTTNKNVNIKFEKSKESENIDVISKLKEQLSATEVDSE